MEGGGSLHVRLTDDGRKTQVEERSGVEESLGRLAETPHDIVFVKFEEIHSRSTRSLRFQRFGSLLPSAVGCSE